MITYQLISLMVFISTIPALKVWYLFAVFAKEGIDPNRQNQEAPPPVECTEEYQCAGETEI